MDRFYNHTDRLVADMLEGLALSSTMTLSESDAARIVMRGDWQPSDEGRTRVALISGGGSGHEPTHAGFVGRGMLTAAVAGDVFASPGVEAVLAAIRACTGEAGALLIIKNYTGDRLNFGLAAERARQEGYRVETVIVADDAALPEADQPRGLAGTILVHKVAGYHAEAGDDLDAVTDAARHMASAVRSIGMALSSAALPGRASEQRRAPELGLGIHNEPGARQVDPSDASEAVALVLETLLANDQRLSQNADERFVMLINNLGGCSPQEMQVIARECLTRWGVARLELLIGPDALMSSLDMHGFSLSVAPLDEALETALRAEVEAPAWPGVRAVHEISTFSPRFTHREPAGTGGHDEQRSALMKRLAAAIEESEQALDALDAKVGDGDAGATFAGGARAVIEALDAGELSTGDDARLADELGHLFATAMGGSSGVLLSILMSAAARSLEKGQSFPEALLEGVARMQHYGGAERGDRTLLDALMPAVEALDAGQGLAEAARAAREGANATAEMGKAGAGRSSLVPEASLKGVVDPGAEAVARFFETLAKE